MAETIKKHWDLAVVFGIGAILMITALFAVFPHPVFGSPATTVLVTATVSEYITFQVSATSTTLTPDLVDSGGIVHIASSSPLTLTLNTSSADGYSITVSGADAGLSFGATGTVGMSIATTTVVAGTDAFGLRAVSSDMTIQYIYNWATTTDNVGRASSTASKLASKTSSGNNQKAYVQFVAAADVAQAAGTYTDTITLTAVATP